MSIEPNLKDIFERLNIPLPQPFMPPAESKDFIPIVLVDKFESMGEVNSFHSKQTSRKPEFTHRGIILERAKEYFPSKTKFWNGNVMKNGDKHLKNGLSSTLRKYPPEKRGEENRISMENQKMKDPNQDRSEVEVEDELEVEIGSGEKLISDCKKQTYIKWNQQENMKYLAFIRENKDLFKDIYTRRINKTYKQMSQFIKTRNHQQCRSHHQKMIKKHQTFEQIEHVIISRNKTNDFYKTPKKPIQSKKYPEYSLASQVTTTVKNMVDQVCFILSKECIHDCQSPIMILPSFDELEMGLPETVTKDRIRID